MSCCPWQPCKLAEKLAEMRAPGSDSTILLSATHCLLPGKKWQKWQTKDPTNKGKGKDNAPTLFP